MQLSHESIYRTLFIQARGLLKRELLLHLRSRRDVPPLSVAESFFQLLKRERVRRKTYGTRQEARSDVFSYIEMFYNPIRRHSSADGLSPIEFERRNPLRLEAV